MRDIFGEDIPDPEEKAARRAAFVEEEMARLEQPHLLRDAEAREAHRLLLVRSNAWWDMVRSFGQETQRSEWSVISGLLNGTIIKRQKLNGETEFRDLYQDDLAALDKWARQDAAQLQYDADQGGPAEPIGDDPLRP